MDERRAADALLLGRVTYEGFAAAWPAMEDTTGEFGKKMNGLPKVVVSTTLTEATWKNSMILADDVPTGVAELKRAHDGDILVFGSATLTETLREHNLVDEYRLMVHSVVLGSGKRMFKAGAAGAGLKLVAYRPVGPDVLLLTYSPASH